MEQNKKPIIAIIGCGAEGLTDAVIAQVREIEKNPDVIIVDVDNTSIEELKRLGIRLGIPTHSKKNTAPETKSRPLSEIIEEDLAIPYKINPMPQLEPYIDVKLNAMDFHRGFTPKRGKNKYKR